jgi:type IV pilus modification protein PilV
VERIGREHGFSLLDALIACTILAVGVLSVAHLLAVGVALNGSARDTTVAAVLAAQKLEELRSHPSVDASPADALERDAPGFVDYLDRHGNVHAASDATGTVAYVRRWSTEPVADHPDTVVVQVRVTAGPGSGPDRRAGPRGREIRMVAAKTRKAP